MKRAIIFHSGQYDLVSYGNGASYALHDNTNKQSLFIQYGDEATEFRSELDAWPGAYDDFCAEQFAIRQG